jgi:hypothetical protein
MRHITGPLLDDMDFWHLGLQQDPYEFEWLPPCYREDEALLRTTAVSWGGAFFSSPAGRPHRGRRSLVLAAVGESFDILRHASPELRADEEVVEAAMTGEASHAALTGMCGVARRQLRETWEEGVAPPLKANPEFLKRLLEQQGRLLGVLSREQRGDPTLVLHAVKNDGAALAEADTALWSLGPKRRRVVEAAKVLDPNHLGLARALLQANQGCWSFLPPRLKRHLGLEHFECCVCLDLPIEEIRQCIEGGHLICGPCSRAVVAAADQALQPPTCPVCRGDVTSFVTGGFVYGARNRLAENDLAARLAA